MPKNADVNDPPDDDAMNTTLSNSVSSSNLSFGIFILFKKDIMPMLKAAALNPPPDNDNAILLKGLMVDDVCTCLIYLTAQVYTPLVSNVDNLLILKKSRSESVN